MSDDYPLVAYGASGYTGRLVIEFLREYSIPFVAVARNRERIEEALQFIPVKSWNSPIKYSCNG